MHKETMSLATLKSSFKNDELYATFDDQGNGSALARHRMASKLLSGYPHFMGVTVNLWTVSAVNKFLKTLWMTGDFTETFTYTFTIPELSSNASFPLHIELTDRKGKIYFRQVQTLAVQLIVPNGAKVVSWRKVPEISDFVLDMHKNS